VGGRIGLAILGVLSAEQLALAVAAGDKAAIAQAEGVGPKLAGRIVSELKDKVGALPAATQGWAPVAAHAAAPQGAVADAVSALVNLGYGRSDAFTAVMGAAGRLGDGATVERLVPAALRDLAPL
jgi:Holliday junction DNA helicase RuvA